MLTQSDAVTDVLERAGCLSGCHRPIISDITLLIAPASEMPGFNWADSDLWLIQPGAPDQSLIYLKMSGQHAATGLPGELMPPDGSNYIVEAGDLATLRDWIADAEVPEQLEVRDPDAIEGFLDRRCASCHTTQAAPLWPLELEARPGASHYPRVDPGRPWRSSLYRFAVAHDNALQSINPDVPEEDWTAYIQFASPVLDIPESELLELYEALGG